jgi:hypothetical protein
MFRWDDALTRCWKSTFSAEVPRGRSGTGLINLVKVLSSIGRGAVMSDGREEREEREKRREQEARENQEDRLDRELPDWTPERKDS